MLKDAVGDLLARPARRWTRSRPRIVFYHRIGSRAGDRGLQIKAFEENLRFIVKNFIPLTFRDLLDRTRQGRALPKAPVVLTFDDGYADFISDVLPLLEKHGVPATLFAVSDFVLGRGWLWFDQIRYVLGSAVAGATTFRVGNSAIHLTLRDSTSREQAWHAIATPCLRLTTAERQRVIDGLQRTLNVDLPACPPLEFAPATAEQIARLDSQVIEVGSHTRTHPILAMCDDHELRSELEVSRRDLEDVVGRPVVSLAYPNGMPGDHDQRALQELKRAGYLGAALAHGGLASPTRLSADPLQVPRFGANSDPGTFRREMSGLTHLRRGSSIPAAASGEMTGSQAV